MRNFNGDLKKKGSSVLLICLSLVLFYKFLVYFFLQKDPLRDRGLLLKYVFYDVLFCYLRLFSNRSQMTARYAKNKSISWHFGSSTNTLCAFV